MVFLRTLVAQTSVRLEIPMLPFAPSLVSFPDAKPKSASSALSPTNTAARLGQRCAAPNCSVLVLCARFCDGCVARVAMDCAREIERRLLQSDYRAGSDEMAVALAGEPAAGELTWFAQWAERRLGYMTYTEADTLRNLTTQACLLLAIDAEDALVHLPGAAAAKPVPPALRFADLPDRIDTGVEPAPLSTAETRFQIASLAVLGIFVILVLVVLR